MAVSITRIIICVCIYLLNNILFIYLFKEYFKETVFYRNHQRRVLGNFRILPKFSGIK